MKAVWLEAQGETDLRRIPPTIQHRSNGLPGFFPLKGKGNIVLRLKRRGRSSSITPNLITLNAIRPQIDEGLSKRTSKNTDVFGGVDLITADS